MTQACRAMLYRCSNCHCTVSDSYICICAPTRQQRQTLLEYRDTDSWTTASRLTPGARQLTNKTCMQSISEEIRSATTSMTSVPKPLKFLRKHYDSVKTYYESMPDSDNKPKLADVLSILAISSAASGSRESLRFRLAGSKVCLKPVHYHHAMHGVWAAAA